MSTHTQYFDPVITFLCSGYCAGCHQHVKAWNGCRCVSCPNFGVLDYFNVNGRANPHPVNCPSCKSVPGYSHAIYCNDPKYFYPFRKKSDPIPINYKKRSVN